MEWIMSEGGPLICMEAAKVPTWGGVAKLSVSGDNATTDYDRACSAGFYAVPISLRDGSALVIDTGPQDTSVWTSADGISYIVVVQCAEPGIDESSLLARLNDRIFENPINDVVIEFSSAALVMFDSAHPGDDPDKKSIHFELTAGRYRVLSQTFEPNCDASFVVHKLQFSSHEDE